VDLIKGGEMPKFTRWQSRWCSSKNWGGSIGVISQTRKQLCSLVSPQPDDVKRSLNGKVSCYNHIKRIEVGGEARGRGKRCEHLSRFSCKRL
jgi:hypothetical protein